MASIPATAATTKQPVSAHRAFPAIVALWFAALLGLGSLVLPAGLIDGVARAIGLGETADFQSRIMLALGAAALGAALGLVLARRIADSQGSEPSRAYIRNGSTAAEARTPVKPISAHEELGGETLDPSHGETARKRRSLSVTDENTRSEYLAAVPLPGAEDDYFGPAPRIEIEKLPDVEPEHEPDPEPEVLELIEEEPLELADEVEALPPFADEPEVAFVEVAVEAARPFDAPRPELQPEPPALSPAAQARMAAMSAGGSRSGAQDDREEEHGADDDSSGDYDPFSEMRRELQNPSQPKVTAGPLQNEDFTMNAMSSEFTPVQTETNPPLERRELAELSLVELVERFASALQNRRAAAEAEPAVTRSQPEAEFPAQIPAALQPFSFEHTLSAEEEDEDFDALAPFSLKIDKQARMFDAPAAAELQPVEPERDEPAQTETDLPEPNTAEAFEHSDEYGEDDEPEESTDGDYSSLLDLKRPINEAREFVRIDEADGGDDRDEGEPDLNRPVVVFPGQDTRRAAPAADGPSRDPSTTPAPYHAPQHIPSGIPVKVAGGASAALARPFDAPAGEVTTRPAITPDAYGMQTPNRAKAEETERALREALEKLQRMSGAA